MLSLIHNDIHDEASVEIAAVNKTFECLCVNGNPLTYREAALTVVASLYENNILSSRLLTYLLKLPYFLTTQKHYKRN